MIPSMWFSLHASVFCSRPGTAASRLALASCTAATQYESNTLEIFSYSEPCSQLTTGTDDLCHATAASPSTSEEFRIDKQLDHQAPRQASVNIDACLDMLGPRAITCRRFKHLVHLQNVANQIIEPSWSWSGVVIIHDANVSKTDRPLIAD